MKFALCLSGGAVAFIVSVTEFGVSGASLSLCWDDCAVVWCSWARLNSTAGFIPENTQQLSLQTLTDVTEGK